MFTKPQKLFVVFLIPGMIFLSLGAAAVLAPQLIIYFLAFFCTFVGVLLVGAAYKIAQFISRFSDLQRQLQATVSIKSKGGRYDEPLTRVPDTDIDLADFANKPANEKKIIFH